MNDINVDSIIASIAAGTSTNHIQAKAGLTIKQRFYDGVMFEKFDGVDVVVVCDFADYPIMEYVKPCLAVSAVDPNGSCIWIHDSLWAAATDEQLLAILGHESGHIHLGHIKPHTKVGVKLSVNGKHEIQADRYAQKFASKKAMLEGLRLAVVLANKGKLSEKAAIAFLCSFSPIRMLRLWW
jgi:Zn-dependent protease with chaperone function